MEDTIHQQGLCPYCTRAAIQRHIYTHPTEDKEVDAGRVLGYRCDSYVFICEGCSRILIYTDDLAWPYGDDYDPGDEEVFLRSEAEYFKSHTVLLFPKKDQFRIAVPESIKREYDEAVKSKTSSPNAFAVQIRRCLEAVCHERGIRQGTLGEMLSHLEAEFNLPKITLEIAHQLRFFGNVGAHANRGHIKPDEVEAIDQFFRSVIDYIYVKPAELKELQTLLESYSLRANIEESSSVN